LRLRFGESGIQVVLKTETQPSHIVFAVESISGGEVDALRFLNVPLTLKGSPDEPFGACALSLNLITRVDALPALQKELRAACEKKFGIIGAKMAVAAARKPTSGRGLFASAGLLPFPPRRPLCSFVVYWW
jgi:hypothetical protein